MQFLKKKFERTEEKTMAEYIKRETVINHLDACMDTIWKPEIVALKCFVEGIPAADVAPVQQGQRIAEGEEQNDRRKSMSRLISADALIKNHFSDEHNIALSYANKIRCSITSSGRSVAFCNSSAAAV